MRFLRDFVDAENMLRLVRAGVTIMPPLLSSRLGGERIT